MQGLAYMYIFNEFDVLFFLEHFPAVPFLKVV